MVILHATLCYGIHINFPQPARKQKLFDKRFDECSGAISRRKMVLWILLQFSANANANSARIYHKIRSVSI